MIKALAASRGSLECAAVAKHVILLFLATSTSACYSQKAFLSNQPLSWADGLSSLTLPITVASQPLVGVPQADKHCQFLDPLHDLLALGGLDALTPFV